VGRTSDICTIRTLYLCPSKEETEEHETLASYMTYDVWSNILQPYRKNSGRDGNPAQRLQGLEWLFSMRQLLSRGRQPSTHQKQAVNDRQ